MIRFYKSPIWSINKKWQYTWIKYILWYHNNLGNGFISTNTLKEILKELDGKLTDEDLLNIIEEVDEDGSGTLDFDGELDYNLTFQC